MKKTLKIGVLGPHVCNQEQKKLGLDVGSAIAVRGGILVCGGLSGMMEAAAEGAKKAGGRTVGILPGTDSAEANHISTWPCRRGWARSATCWWSGPATR